MLALGRLVRYFLHVYIYFLACSELQICAFRFAKNNFLSVRFMPENRFESIRPIQFNMYVMSEFGNAPGIKKI